MARLTPSAVARLPDGVSHFGYDRSAQEVGIVHIGVNAFHRAHQAWYTDRAMEGGDRNWAITGISLSSREAATQLNPQGGLFSVFERSAAGTQQRVVGSLRKVLPPAVSRMRAAREIAARPTRIVSLTVSHGEYCQLPGGSIDLEAARRKTSIYPILAEGLRLRRDRGLGGLTLLSCDNFAQNGRVLGKVLTEFCAATDQALAAWVASECTFPCTVVDRIVPAFTTAEYCQLQTKVALWDEAAVITEPFSQWIVEDAFACGRPRWDRVGAQMVTDVTRHETAKLRMLNGAHSALAYLGLSRGLSYVHEAVADPAIRPLVDSLMRQEAATSLVGEGAELDCYADSIWRRFENPGLRHMLSEIAIGGSEKIAQRWLDTLAFHARSGQACPAILTALGGWLRHVRGDHGEVVDASARELRRAWERYGRHGIVEGVFGRGGVCVSQWVPSAFDRQYILETL